MLAYYLECNRKDWTGGYDYANTGLNQFSVDTDQDKEIYEYLYQRTTEFAGIDGRVFEDCKWNYEVLYGLADDELLNDLVLAREIDSSRRF